MLHYCFKINDFNINIKYHIWHPFLNFARLTFLFCYFTLNKKSHLFKFSIQRALTIGTDTFTIQIQIWENLFMIGKNMKNNLEGKILLFLLARNMHCSNEDNFPEV